jgi:DNA-binding response OmpR family regulator
MNLHGKRVLIVEDDSLIAFDTGNTLERALGARITLRRFDLSELSASLKTDPADLMIIDLCADQNDRLKLVRLALSAGTPVVIGTVCDEDRHGLKGYEQIPVLVKPYDPARLVQIVKSELRPCDPGRCLNERMPA